MMIVTKKTETSESIDQSGTITCCCSVCEAESNSADAEVLTLASSEAFVGASRDAFVGTGETAGASDGCGLEVGGGGL